MAIIHLQCCCKQAGQSTTVSRRYNQAAQDIQAAQEYQGTRSLSNQLSHSQEVFSKPSSKTASRLVMLRGPYINWLPPNLEVFKPASKSTNRPASKPASKLGFVTVPGGPLPVL